MEAEQAADLEKVRLQEEAIQKTENAAADAKKQMLVQAENKIRAEAEAKVAADAKLQAEAKANAEAKVKAE